MASCAPPKSAQNEMNELLRAQPLPRACPTPIPLSTAATQTELTMDALTKIELKLEELKVENRRLRQNGYARKYNAKQKKLKRAIANASQEQAELKVESRLKNNEQCRKIRAAKKRKLEQLMIANANLQQVAAHLEQAARHFIASSAVPEGVSTVQIGGGLAMMIPRPN